MRKLLVIFLTLFLFTGCSNITSTNKENTDLRIADAITSIGNVDNTMEKQRLDYEFTIGNEGKVDVKEDSIEIILNDWIKGKLIEEKITEKSFNENSIIIKGYVIFDSKGTNKNNVIENEPLIKGISVHTDNGAKTLIKNES